MTRSLRVAGMDMVLEYTLASAAVAKGFTSYLASLVGRGPGSLRHVPPGGGGIIDLDPLAAGLVVLVAAGLARSTRGSALLDSAMVVVQLVLIVFVVAAGGLQVSGQ